MCVRIQLVQNGVGTPCSWAERFWEMIRRHPAFLAQQVPFSSTSSVTLVIPPDATDKWCDV